MCQRLLAMVLLAATSGCDRKAADAPAAVAAPTEVAFDGANVKDAAARLAHGKRIGWALGCHGCHGKDLDGHRFYEAYASNLTRDLAAYSDQQIEHVLRVGERPSGKPLWGMPSEVFQHLSDADMTALIADLRSLKPKGGPTQAMLPFEAETKELIASGKFKPAADFVKEWKDKRPVDLGPEYAQGRYIASVTCAECHGSELQGDPGFTPDLIVAGAYSRDEFETLLTEGKLPGGRKFKNPLMGEVAVSRFTHFTPHERDALYAYLKARAELPQ
ncbi:c-type cytochrome [Sphingomonas daechungensis]|uniref:c-type cytochrome n=1 Tax=Sphingomonas daechungensis TaxID=1176646 RepID=UPI0037850C49